MRSMRWKSTLCALGFTMLLAPAVRGQGTRAAGPLYGTTSTTQLRVGFAEFTPATSTTPYGLESAATYFGRSSTTTALFIAHPHIPTGAHLESLELDFCDNDPALHMILNLEDCDLNGGGCNTLGQITSSDLGATRCGNSIAVIAAANYTVQNGVRELVLEVFTNSGSNTNILNGAAIGYRLQVSPAPAVATFADVPTTAPQFRFVEALVAAGITAGCGNGNYCPNDAITRGQMAVFLAAALGLHFPN